MFKSVHTRNLILIAVCALVVYSNSAFSDFVWDDEFLVKENTHIQALIPALKHSFVHNIYPEELFESPTGYFRPVQVLSYALDHKFWAKDPFGYHVSNILLHILASLLVYIFLFLLTNDIFTSLIAAVFFSVHPVHTEAVAYISGRADMLSAIFMLSALCLFINFRKSLRPKPLYLYPALFTLAICSFLSKEYSLILPVLFAAFDLSFGFLNKRNAGIYLVFLPVYLVYGLLRFNALDTGYFLPAGPYFRLLISEFPLRMMVFLKSLPVYVSLLIAPVNLHMQRTIENPSGFVDTVLLSSVAAFIVMTLIVSAKYKARLVYRFMLVWFLVLMFSQSYVFIAGARMADHFLYLASISFFLMFAVLIKKIIKKSGKLRVFGISAAVLLFLFFSSQTVFHNLNWRNNLVLYTWTLKHSPKSILARYNLGLEYALLRSYPQAFLELNKAKQLLNDLSPERYKERDTFISRIDSVIGINYFNLAMEKTRQGDVESAKVNFLKAVEFKPDYVQARSNLAGLYMNEGRLDEARLLLEQNLTIKPDDPLSLYNLAVVFLEMNDSSSAQKVINKALMSIDDRQWSLRLKGLLKQ